MAARHRAVHRLKLAAVLALVLVAATACGGHAAVPRQFIATVQSARQSLLAEDDDPAATYRFLSIRCREGRARLVIFDRGSLFGRTGFGYAVQGPTASSWSGGIGMDDLQNDAEIQHFFSTSPDTPCVQPA